MEWQQHTQRAVLAALVCTGLSAGTAWAATPQVSTVDVQQLSQAQGLVVDSDDKKRQSVEQESTDAQGHVQMGIADAGSQAAKNMQQQASAQPSVHEQAWDIMSMPLRWQSVEQAEKDREAAEQAKPQGNNVPVAAQSAPATNKAAQVVSAAKPSVQVAKAQSATSTVQGAATAKTAPMTVTQPQVQDTQTQTTLPKARNIYDNRGLRSPQQIVEVPPANGAVKPIIITARDIDKQRRQELLKPQKQPTPGKPVQQPAQSQPAPGQPTQPQQVPAVNAAPAAQSAPANQPAATPTAQAVNNQQTTAPVAQQPGTQTAAPAMPSVTSTQPPKPVVPSATNAQPSQSVAQAAPAQQPSVPAQSAAAAAGGTVVDGQPDHRINRQWAPGRRTADQPTAAQPPVQPAQSGNVAQPTVPQPPVQPAPPHEAPTVPIPALPPEPPADAMTRPEPFRNVSETTWRHIQAGILATQMMLQTECTEHGMYLLAQMLNQSSLTHLAKIDYLIGIGYAINHSSLLNDWQKNAFLDAFLQFCE